MVTIRPSEIMRGKLLHGKRGNRIRKALIVVQFLASFVLIAGTFTVFQQVRYMQREAESDLNTRILVIKYPSFTEGLSLRMESFTKRLKQRADVSHVTVSGAVPGVEVANYFTNRPYGSDPSQVKLIQMFSVDYDYLSAYMPRMICGRSFPKIMVAILTGWCLTKKLSGCWATNRQKRRWGNNLKWKWLVTRLR